MGRLAEHFSDGEVNGKFQWWEGQRNILVVVRLTEHYSTGKVDGAFQWW